MKKKYLITFLILFFGFSAYAQDYLRTADNCYAQGDYGCASKNYYLYLSKTENKTIREKYINSQKCEELLMLAEESFEKGDYRDAKRHYEAILRINSGDPNAKRELEKCNNFLNPPSSSNTRTTPSASTTPSATRTPSTTLTVGTQNLTFGSSGGNEKITVTTNAATYDIISLPSWCKVYRYSGYFTIYCDRNRGNSARNDWFKVVAGDKEIRINVSQSSTQSSSRVYTSPQSPPKPPKPPKPPGKGFNNPKAHHPVGLSVGYVVQSDDEYGYADDYLIESLEGIQAGLRIEPLFKYGFGLNMGVFYEYYSRSYSYFASNGRDLIENRVILHEINVPLHLEYRLNFHKDFNLFFYGGVSMNLSSESMEDIFSSETKFYRDFGGGLRMDRVQINIGTSAEDTRKKTMISLSYMF